MTSIFKKRFLVLCLATAASSCFIACHKDKDAQKTKLQQFQQKWNLVMKYDTIYGSAFGPSDTLQYAGKSGDYYEFRKDDTLATSISGVISRSPYHNFNDTTMTFTDYFYGQFGQNTILNLTDSTLEFSRFQKNNARGDMWTKTHVYLKR